jgi:hypothetical protein
MTSRTIEVMQAIVGNTEPWLIAPFEMLQEHAKTAHVIRYTHLCMQCRRKIFYQTD